MARTGVDGYIHRRASGFLISAAAPPSYVSGNATNSAGAASLAVNAPASIVANNFLVAFVYSGSNTPAPTFGGPAGFTQAGVNTPATGQCAAVYSKVATGSEPATYAFTCTGGGVTGIVILQYSGASAVDAATFNSATSTTSGTAPSATATGSSDTWVVCVGDNAAGAIPSTPTGFTARNSSVAAGARGVWSFDKALTASGATGTAAFTFGSAEFYASASILLKP